jgi:hypothetical protein
MPATAAGCLKPGKNIRTIAITNRKKERTDGQNPF